MNLAQAETLVNQVMARLDLQGNETVFDLYSGVGLFTAFIAERAASVVAIEHYPPAVTDADKNLAAFENVTLIEGAVEDVLPDFTDETVDAVVLDPPRTGMELEALNALITLAPTKIVYVSCDVATFSRDAKRLVASGYQLSAIQPIDMFPQTWHIELIATLTRFA